MAYIGVLKEGAHRPLSLSNMINKLDIDDHTIHFTVHALDRYRQRVKASLSRDQALSDLLLLKESATIGPAPEWVEMGREGLLGTSIDTWLFYGDDISFPIQDTMAITCVSRGSISDITRVARNNKKKAYRRRRSSTALSLGKRKIAPPKIDDWA